MKFAIVTLPPATGTSPPAERPGRSLILDITVVSPIDTQSGDQPLDPGALGHQ